MIDKHLSRYKLEKSTEGQLAPPNSPSLSKRYKLEKNTDRPAPLLSTSNPSLCKITLNSKREKRVELCDWCVSFWSPPLLFIEGNQGYSAMS